MTTEPSALIFMDTETTGLALNDDVWEFAAIRREPDGTETEHHLFIEHDHGKVADLPPEFRADHDRRFPGDPNNAVSAALTRPGDDVCGHGIPRALVDCEKCETTWKANADA